MSKYGFVKIERDFIQSIPDANEPIVHHDTSLPQTELARKVLQFAKSQLSTPILNHSLRVYLYSKAIIKDQFPDWNLDEEVIFVTALLHDLGTTDENLKATKMSFEYFGAIKARELVLKETNGDQDYADAVCEAIIRHQDLNDKGYITQLGLIIQISTVLDNAGFDSVSSLIHSDTLKVVNERYNRDNWLKCFAGVVQKENVLKPWGHTSSLGVEEFPANVLKNPLHYT